MSILKVREVLQTTTVAVWLQIGIRLLFTCLNGLHFEEILSYCGRELLYYNDDSSLVTSEYHTPQQGSGKALKSE